MSEKSPSPKPRYSLKQKIGAGALVVGLGLGIGADVKHDNRQDAKIEALNKQLNDAKRDSLDVAQFETVRHDHALERAADYTRLINEARTDRKPIHMQVLNGVVNDRLNLGYKSGKGGIAPTYRDLIILELVDPTVKPDANGNFLKGGWLGALNYDKNGDLIVRPIAYNEKYDFEFIPNDPKKMLLSVAAFSEPGEDGLYRLFGYDPQTNKLLHNSDGSPVQPGFVKPSK